MEEAYLLTQAGGFAFSDVLDMTASERDWFIRRLARDRPRGTLG